MEEQNKGKKAQGVELPKEKKTTSPSYVVRQFNQNVEKLKELKFVDDEDIQKLQEVQEKVVKKFIGLDLF